jgi:hypothetical protein
MRSVVDRNVVMRHMTTIPTLYVFLIRLSSRTNLATLARITTTRTCSTIQKLTYTQHIVHII